MSDTLREWVLKYGIIAGRRFYKKDKIKFIKLLNDEITEMGFNTSLLYPENSKGNATDLLVGDLKTASHIIVTAFDTPTRSFGLYRYEPFNIKLNRKNYAISVILPLLLVCITSFLFTFFFLRFDWLSGPLSVNHLFAIIAYALFIWIIIRVSKGVPNSKNLNRNSSGVITLLNHMKIHGVQKNVAYAFLDHGCSNHLGTVMLKEYLGSEVEKRATFVLIDSVGIGDTFGVCSTKKRDSHKLRQSVSRNIEFYSMNTTTFSLPNLYTHTTCVSCTHNPQSDAFVVKNANSSKDLDVDLVCIQEATALIQVLIQD